MGMDNLMLSCIRALAENRIHTQSDITKYLIEQIVSRVTAEVTGAV